jgi:hypothetical protein
MMRRHLDIHSSFKGHVFPSRPRRRSPYQKRSLKAADTPATILIISGQDITAIPVHPVWEKACKEEHLPVSRKLITLIAGLHRPPFRFHPMLSSHHVGRKPDWSKTWAIPEGAAGQ